MNLHLRFIVDGVPVTGKVVAIEGSPESLAFLAQSAGLKSKNPDHVFGRIVEHAPYAIDITTPDSKPDGFGADMFSPPFGGKRAEGFLNTEDARLRQTLRAIGIPFEAFDRVNTINMAPVIAAVPDNVMARISGCLHIAPPGGSIVLFDDASDRALGVVTFSSGRRPQFDPRSKP